MIEGLGELLTDSCDIYEETTTQGSMGGANAGTPSLIAAAIPCRWEKIKPDVAQIIYGKFDATKQYRVYMGTDYALTVQHYLSKGGKSYQVWAINNVDLLGSLVQVDVTLRPI